MGQDEINKKDDYEYLKNAIAVNSIEEEYEYVNSQRCKCGGCYERTMQSFSEGPIEHDILTVKCVKCGLEAQFVFDISSFYGKGLEEMHELLKELEQEMNSMPNELPDENMTETR